MNQRKLVSHSNADIKEHDPSNFEENMMTPDTINAQVGSAIHGNVPSYDYNQGRYQYTAVPGASTTLDQDNEHSIANLQ